MKGVRSFFAVMTVALGLPVQAATTDPEVIIYRFPGVQDDGGASFVGVATVFHCTNFSGVTENLRFVTRNSNSTLVSNSVLGVIHLGTVAVSTHAVMAYDAVVEAAGSISHGTTAIAATSSSIICTAMTIDAANRKPDGVALRGIRFSPAPGTQE